MMDSLFTPLVRLLFGPLLALVLSSCGGPRLEVQDRPITETKAARALTTSGALTPVTSSTLREEDLLRTYKDDPMAAIRSLAVRYQAEPTEERRFALAELISDAGDRITGERPYAAVGHYLDAARLTKAAAIRAIGTRVEDRDETLYNYCAARVARILHEMPDGGATARTVNGPLQSYRFTVATGREFSNPRTYDVLVPDTWLKPDNIKLEEIEQDGFGVSMVGQLKATPERKVAEPNIPSTGFGVALNASLRFSGDRATLALQNLMVDGTAEVSGREVPLDGHFTAPLYFLYSEGAGRPNKLLATLRPDAYKDTIKLFSIEPFDENKIPLVLVHGLLSTAEGWLPFANRLRADPVIRERYQLVFFNYPTGTSIGKNSADLRDALEQFRKDYDPGRNTADMRKMVILGHSMGGILSNNQIRDSGDRVYRSLFTRDLDEVGVKEETEAYIRRVAFFESNPDIKRAILIASPLRGSDFATNKIGQFGAWLIRMPFDIVDAALGELDFVNSLTNVAQQASHRPRNSVNSLRPDNPALTVVLECPVRKGVPIHSIIARRKPEVPLLESGDGVVPYTSAHLDEAVSELVVDGANHRSVLANDQCFEEVWRVLYLHAGLKWQRRTDLAE